MARLPLRLADGRDGWIEMEFAPLPSDPEGVTVHLSICPDQSGHLFAMTGSTEGWQVGRVYFETMARAFARSAAFAPTRFGTSYYQDPSARPPECTLHLDMEWLHILFRGIRNNQIAVDCFVQDAPTDRFAHIAGSCSVAQAEQFGQSLLSRLEHI